MSLRLVLAWFPESCAESKARTFPPPLSIFAQEALVTDLKRLAIWLKDSPLDFKRNNSGSSSRSKIRSRSETTAPSRYSGWLKSIFMSGASSSEEGLDWPKRKRNRVLPTTKGSPDSTEKASLVSPWWKRGFLPL